MNRSKQSDTALGQGQQQQGPGNPKKSVRFSRPCTIKEKDLSNTETETDSECPNLVEIVANKIETPRRRTVPMTPKSFMDDRIRVILEARQEAMKDSQGKPKEQVEVVWRDEDKPGYKKPYVPPNRPQMAPTTSTLFQDRPPIPPQIPPRPEPVMSKKELELVRKKNTQGQSKDKDYETGDSDSSSEDDEKEEKVEPELPTPPKFDLADPEMFIEVIEQRYSRNRFMSTEDRSARIEWMKEEIIALMDTRHPSERKLSRKEREMLENQKSIRPPAVIFRGGFSDRSERFTFGTMYQLEDGSVARGFKPNELPTTIQKHPILEMKPNMLYG